jgi:hypothetical protein
MKPLSADSAEQAEFHRWIGAIVEAYAWFDFNLGLKLNAWPGSNASDVLDAAKPLKVRLDRLIHLVGRSTASVSPEQTARWEEWLEVVNSARALRNDYAHGRWIKEGDIGLGGVKWRLVPLQWSAGLQEPVEPITLTCGQLEAQRNQISWAMNRMHEAVAPFQG